MSAIRERIASILNIPNTDSWDIIDSHPRNSLYLVHYTPDAPMGIYGSVRGIVVDTEAGVIVARDYGYTPISISDELEVDSVDNKVHLVDASNTSVDFKLDPERTIFRPCFDGVLVRVFMHNGVVYHSTHKRIDMSYLRKRVDDPTYKEIYLQLNGPSDEELFDLSKKYSPFVHLFYMSGMGLQEASKNIVGDGILVYLGSRRMWKNGSYYPEGEVETLVKNIKGVSKFKQAIDKGVIYTPPSFGIDRVNKYLKFGFKRSFEGYEEYPPRLLPGEFIIANILNEDKSDIIGAVRIESNAYRWRSNMLDKNNNRYEQLCNLSNGKFIRTDILPERDVYLRRFPILTPYSIDELKEQIPINRWIQDPLTDVDKILSDFESRFYNIFLGFLYSVPSEEQDEVVNYYDMYWQDLFTVIDWLVKLYRSGNISIGDIPLRAKRIISLAVGFAQEKIYNEGESIKEDMDELVELNIDRLIRSEEGGSLYKLIVASKLT